MRFKKVAVYGVGLLGGSLALALKRRGLAEHVAGLGRSAEKLQVAQALGILDSAEQSPAKALDKADALVVCLPPRQIREAWAELAPHVARGTFVTDVGSVKQAIVAEGDASFDPAVDFIGSHPMAGSEKSGIEHADAGLFEGASCLVTPSARTSGRALALAVAFWGALGSRPIVMDPKRHDAVVAAVSHLPHLAAVALVEALYVGGDATALYRNVLGNGFRDSTRIAAGEPALWEDIFTQNAPALVDNLDKLIEILTEWRGLLSQGGSSRDVVGRLREAARHRGELGAPADPDPP